MSQPREFDVCGPLPSGVTVLEASAGTGKTYTIAALAARYVAEGIPLERMLLVTFTRMATGELRERVRDRLIEVERGLGARLAGAASAGDPIVDLLFAGDAVRARSRLARAVAGFDAATIATTHGFCQEVLGGLGIAGDLEPDVTFVEDLSDLAADVVDDLYVRKFRRGEAPAFKLGEASEIARAAIDNPSAVLIAASGPVPEMRTGLARAAREELERRKRAAGVMTYDDLVTRLQTALRGPAGEAARASLRWRFDVVLVDEFQDTDPAQWEIMREAFAGNSIPTHPTPTGPTLVLIADPKQAIYAFRGADVYAYLQAAKAADEQATLRVNWRSDQGLIDAHDALFSDARLGHEGIVYRQVRAAPEHQVSRLTGAPAQAPMRFRVAMRESRDLALTPRGFAKKGSAQQFIADDLAGDVVALLSSEARIDDEVVCPGHLAALVRTNWQAALVRQALDDAGVPAVINGAGSVFGTDIAREWLRLIEALERPASMTRAHSAALTCFLGWSAQRLAHAGAEDDSWEWEEVHRRLHDWARILRTRGVAALLETITVAEDLSARMLADDDGERRLTDLRHVGQLLHRAASAEQLGPTALATWLRTRITEAMAGIGDEERSRRLESDAEAVQVLTIHRSKGLEFPIVYAPFLWEGWEPRGTPPVFFHDPANRDVWSLDVALDGADYNKHLKQFVREERGEELRLAYVALTRARHQAIVWWAGSYDSRNSPLGRLLFSRDEAGNVAPSGDSIPDDVSMLARLGKLAERAQGAISVERAVPDRSARWSPSPLARAKLEVSSFDRSLDLRWRRTSYTDITSASYDAWVDSEPEQPLISDEPAEDAPVAATALAVAPELAAPSLLGEMPVGADVGTFVHRVLEATDFAAADLEAELGRCIDEVRARRAIEIGDSATVAAGLCAALRTPLGPVLGGMRLCDVTRADRLDELGFELPLAGGDEPRGWLRIERIAEVLREHLPDGDLLAGYAQRLEDPFLRRSVRGYLTGSLDLVVRRVGEDGVPRFAVLDYKTNWLGEPGEPLTTFHYRPDALSAEMSRHHYALQALLYTVALHRFLRWRLRDYDPDTHLAGVAYLFVRGMTGADWLGGSSDSPGVFGWTPPVGLAAALSDALDEGSP
jgi:exodeoxyribonuclease V beta subunit